MLVISDWRPTNRKNDTTDFEKLVRRATPRLRAALASLTAVLGLLALAPTAGAYQPGATMNGGLFEDGLDTRLSAQRMGEAARRIGYESYWYFGRSAADSWFDGRDSTVYGLFGHGTSGIVQTAEGVNNDDHFILSGKADTPDPSLGTRYFWKDYAPGLDVDDMKLAILAGCHTASDSSTWGNFGRMGRERGIDSTVSFADFVYYPGTCTGTTNCSYAGNYFWERFAVYAEGGDTVGVALSKARQDLVTKEGSAKGWDSSVVFGSSDTPGDVRIAPAGEGQAWDSKPLGIDPFDPFGLTLTWARDILVEGTPYTDFVTSQGVSYRTIDPTSNIQVAGPPGARSVPALMTGSTGASTAPAVMTDTGQVTNATTPGGTALPTAPRRGLVWLQAPAATQGEVKLDKAAARGAALDFLSSYVDRFDREGFKLTERKRVSHLDGDELYSFTWRPQEEGRSGPAAVTAEVDRRTGAVVFLSAARPKDVASTEVTVSRQQAIGVAVEKAGAGRVKEARADVWERPRWTVTIDQGKEEPTPRLVEVTVDGVTGKVISTSRT